MKSMRRLLARALGRDANPLLRHSDRVEARVFAALLAIFLLAAPAAALIAARLAGQAGARAEQAQRSWRQVSATVLRPSSTGTSLYGAGTVIARWAAPGGRQVTGAVPVNVDIGAGQRMPVWTDAAGRLVSVPVTSSTVRRDELLAAGGGVVALVPLLMTAYGCTFLALNRRRMADWEREWRTFGPRWSHQP